METNVVKFPYSAARRVHSQKPRRSKNGTPEERAAKIAAMQSTPAEVVDLSPQIDRRKLRSSPLRDQVTAISFGATVVGKMRTAELKGEPLAAIPPEIRQEWLEDLHRAIGALATVAVGITEALETLKQVQSETSDFPVNLPVLEQIVLNLAGSDHEAPAPI
jgi:hypothetical protein